MTNISTKANWQKLIDEANRHDITAGPRPATDEEIDSVRQRAAQRGLEVHKDFVTFLRYANGFGYNSLTIPCAQLSPKRHSDDFVEYNDALSFLERPVYGNIDDTYYVLSPDGKFQCISASDDVISTHNTFFDMLTEALLPAVLSTVDRDRIAELDLHLDKFASAS